MQTPARGCRVKGYAVIIVCHRVAILSAEFFEGMCGRRERGNKHQAQINGKERHRKSKALNEDLGIEKKLRSEHWIDMAEEIDMTKGWAMTKGRAKIRT
jgi:hypothetical protein